MKVAVYSTHKFEKEYLVKATAGRHELVLFEVPLSKETALLAKGSEAVCIFVNDDASSPVLESLYQHGVRFLVLRSAGFNNVDLQKAGELGLSVARVPEYSPFAVAEHTVALMLALNRKLIRAHSRIRELNFSLDGLIGFDMHGKTAGVIGLGKIGRRVVEILRGFGCKVLAFDPAEDKEWAQKHDVTYVPLDELFKRSDIISLHAPLTPATKYIVNAKTIAGMKKGVMLVNTGRGALIHTRDAIEGLKSGQIGYLGLDVVAPCFPCGCSFDPYLLTP